MRRAGLLALCLLAVAVGSDARAGRPASVFQAAAASLREEAQLLPLAGPGHSADPNFPANRRRLVQIDGRGAELLALIRSHGVEPTAVVLRTLGRLHVPGQGVLLPLPGDYLAAIVELRSLDAAHGGDPAFAMPVGIGPPAARAAPQSSQRGVLLVGGLVAVLIALIVGLIVRGRGLSRAPDLLALSLTDPLTGSSTRRKLEQDVEASSDDESSDVCVLMIDVDHFKEVNDRYGHPVGDEVLRRVGRVLLDQVRDGTTVYRYGGEEFCVILRDVTLLTACSVADRLRSSVALTRMPTDDSVTISLGVAHGPSGALDTVIGHADSALYEAKRAGRDTVREFKAAA